MVVEIIQISNEMPVIQEKLNGISDNLSSWLNDRFGVTFEQITGLLKDKSSKAMSMAGEMLAGFVAGIFTLVGSVLLALVFTFLFLLHREKYENFVIMLFEKDRQDEVRQIIGKVSRIAQRYLGGRIVSITILLILYLIGFFAVGLKNSILLASIAALLTFIPYVGPFVGGLFPIIMSFITGSVNQAMWITGVIVAAQLFQNYFVEPTVVGGSVSISPFFTILILIAGGMVWGVAGIILFLPMLGILKIIFENVQPLRPFAYLIGGEEDSGPGKILSSIKGWFSAKKQ
jgi:predicted PurR-regulated permease PerM